MQISRGSLLERFPGNRLASSAWRFASSIRLRIGRRRSLPGFSIIFWLAGRAIWQPASSLMPSPISCSDSTCSTLASGGFGRMKARPGEAKAADQGFRRMFRGDFARNLRILPARQAACFLRLHDAKHVHPQTLDDRRRGIRRRLSLLGLPSFRSGGPL